jgi:hypothetical protein
VIELEAAIRRLQDPPVQIYSILSQAWPDLPEREFTANLLALHAGIRGETSRFAEALARVEALCASPPSPFRPQADPRRYPPLDSRQYRFLFPHQGGESFMRHLPEGERYLRQLGFSPADPGSLQEAEFHLSGSPSLDFIEIAVRDLLGIDRGVHGRQTRAISGAVFMLRNLVLEVGARLGKACPWAVLYFEKPGAPGTIGYDIFRAALRTLLEDHNERGTFPYACLLQRKLGLGRGAEFCLRIQLPQGPDPSLDAFLHDFFHEEGALEALRFALAIQEEIPIPGKGEFL